MAEVSIDIEAMDSLIGDLESVREDMPSEVSTIRGRLEYVLLSTESVSSVGPGGALWSWLDEAIRDCHRRLALARVIAASSPGISTVTFDDSVLSDLTEAELEDLLDEVEDLMTTDDIMAGATDIDPRLVEILNEHAHDPYFAQMLAERIPPQALDRFLDRIAEYRYMQAVGEDVTAFDERYNELLNGLGMAFGLASTNTGETAVPGFTESWTSYLDDRLPFEGSHQRLSMVIGRGTWSTDFLVGMYETFLEAEGGQGADAWPEGGSGGPHLLIEPNLEISPGGDIVGDPFVGLFRAMETNPEAVGQIFGQGPTTTVEFDGTTYGDVNAALYDFLRTRGSGEATVLALVGALGAGIAAPPVEGQTAWQAVLGEDVQIIADSIEAEVAYAEANTPPWWSRLGHTLLDLAGLIPVVGEAADGINGLWYLAEGDHINAGISFGSMLPVAGWFVQGGKWVKRAFSADELATLGRLADNGEIVRYLPGGRVAANAADLADPSNYRPGSFLSANDLRRFSGDRAWLQPLVAGRRFDDFMTPNYPHNQIRVLGPDGRYYILDSWTPGQRIVSRKLTQLADVQPQTARNYIDELVDKYPAGARVQDTPSARAAGIDGDELTGIQVLEVPPQAGPIPADVLEYAHENGVRIIDVNGVDHTRHLFDPPTIPGGPQ